MLAERPQRPPQHEITQIKRGFRTFYIIPDCLGFGYWHSYSDAKEAKQIWESRYQSHSAKWRSYCEARGWSSVTWH
jgi:hypothetical protein